MTAADGFGPWLRRQREQRLWTRAELARRIIQSARDHGDTTMPSAKHLTHNLYRWERGTVGPSDRYRLYCYGVLGVPPGQRAAPVPPARPDAAPARPTPATDAASGGQLIIIMITVPEGSAARVRIADPAGAPPDSGQIVTI